MIGLLAFLLPLSLFLGLPSTMWNFDGVACAAALELGRPDYFFHANHLLYGFLGFLFWRFLCAPLGIARALPALQLFTSLLSAAGLVGLYKLLASMLENTWAALGLTLSLAVTAAFWVWSVEAQVYPLGFLALAWATMVLFKEYSPRKYLWVGLLHAAAILGHQMHALWIVPALYWMNQDRACTRRDLAQYLGALSAATGIPYAIVLLTVIAPSRDLSHILIWLKGSAGLTSDRHWAWHFPGWTGPWIWLKSTAPALWGSFWPYGQTVVTSWIWLMTMISAGLFLFILIRALSLAVTPTKAPHSRRSPAVWRVGAQSKVLGSGFRRNDGVQIHFALLWLGTYGLFLSTWEPATLCYRMVDILPIGILLAVGLQSMTIIPQAVLISLLLATTLTVNLATRIGPMHRVEENSLYQETLTLSKITSPDSLYITEGGISWMYLLYFTGRTAWNRSSMDPQRLNDEIARQKKIRPVYHQNGSAWEQIR